jgi:histidinol phosphatase-like PHP family hydrolase
MFDLHTHSLFSDGELIPSELVRRMEVMGYTAVAVTDHADSSNLDFIIPRIKAVALDLNQSQSVKVVPGVELTHVPPNLIRTLTRKARELGAVLVVVHGETPVEPVAPGTNRAALEAGADILAHPGLITREEAALAARKNVFLEISGRSGHSFANGHVAKMATEVGAKLVLNSDAHAPRDFMAPELMKRIVEGSGLPAGSWERLQANSKNLLERVGYRV